MEVQKPIHTFPPGFLSLKEAAMWAGISTKTLKRWVEKGLPLHEDKVTCEYCGNIIKQERKEELLAHFSEDLKNLDQCC